MTRQITFDFPKDADDLRQRLKTAGLSVMDLWPGQITFHCPSPRAAIDHLLGSGAGTAYYEAVDPARRPALTARYEQALAHRHSAGPVDVTHDYLGCIAWKSA